LKVKFLQENSIQFPRSSTTGINYLNNIFDVLVKGETYSSPFASSVLRYFSTPGSRRIMYMNQTHQKAVI